MSAIAGKSSASTSGKGWVPPCQTARIAFEEQSRVLTEVDLVRLHFTFLDIKSQHSQNPAKVVRWGASPNEENQEMRKEHGDKKTKRGRDVDRRILMVRVRPDGDT